MPLININVGKNIFSTKSVTFSLIKPGEGEAIDPFLFFDLKEVFREILAQKFLKTSSIKTAVLSG